MNENEKEVIERLTACEESTKSAHKRIDEIKELTQSVCDMVVEVRHMREDLNRMQGEMNDIKSKPASYWDKVISGLIAAAVSVLVGMMFGGAA